MHPTACAKIIRGRRGLLLSLEGKNHAHAEFFFLSEAIREDVVSRRAPNLRGLGFCRSAPTLGGASEGRRLLSDCAQLSQDVRRRPRLGTFGANPGRSRAIPVFGARS